MDDKRRLTVSIDTGALCLVVADLRQTFDRLPLNVRLELAPVFERIMKLEVVTVTGTTAHASPLLMTFAQLVDRLADQLEP